MPQQSFATSDLALAAYLTVTGYAVRDIVCDSQGKGKFVLDDKPERAGQVLAFFNRRAMVEPMAFLDQVKILKAMLNQR